MIAALGSFYLNSAWAIDCYFTLVKDSCWTKFNVDVEVSDAITFKHLLNISVPAGTSWKREPFVCTVGQKISYKAKFSPEIWEGDTKKVFLAQRFWQLPREVKENQTAWEVAVCYPKQFSEVPLPANVSGDCKCDFSVVPKIEPKIIDAVSAPLQPKS